MAITKSTITGDLPLPDGTVTPGSYVEFTLMAADRETYHVVQPVTVSAPIGPGGGISVDLWPNGLGERETRYRVTANIVDPVRRRATPIDLGVIKVPVGGASIANLLPIRVAGAKSEAAIHRGDSRTFALQWLNADGRPAVMSGFALSARLERGGVEVPLGVAWISAAAGTLEITLSAAVSAGLPIGAHRLVVRATSGARVTSLRGTINII